MIVLVRHGETEWSASRRHTGNTDLPLTEEGARRRAPSLRERLAGHDFALVLTSPAAARARDRRAGRLRRPRRARRRPARVRLRRLRGADHRRDPRASGPAGTCGTTASRAARRPSSVGARADRVIARALDAGGDVALFAHGHILRVLGAPLDRARPRPRRPLALGTAAVCGARLRARAASTGGGGT